MNLETIWDIINTLIAGFALYLGWKHNASQKQDTFIKRLTENLINLRSLFAELDIQKCQTDISKGIFINNIHKYTMYQVWEKEKTKYLSKSQQEELSDLQLEAEDFFGQMLNAPKDIKNHKEVVNNRINDFLRKL
jgi:hypothetical protein